MAKIKYTKNELKRQRDSLAQFERYLPTLELKRQQLQIEVRKIESAMRAKQKEADVLFKDMESWTRLFADNIDYDEYVKVERIRRDRGNIAGVTIPLFSGVDFQFKPVDFYNTDPWLDDGLNALRQLVALRAELVILQEQEKLLNEELLVTTQRVNLFEKVKIPECSENIRVIRIFLGDQDAAAVVRSKIAKNKAVV
ncbi:MAG: V-type ATP synthase subunit D [Lentisphaerae bacterium]|nr:V-type ATP synthase subunit D [Lentisphaerota bacterium]